MKKIKKIKAPKWIKENNSKFEDEKIKSPKWIKEHNSKY